MKHTYWLVLLALLAISCNSITGSGHIVRDVRHTGTFNGISVGDDFDVVLQPGESYNVIVEADDNIVSRIRTKVKDAVLEISTGYCCGFRNARKTIYVTAPEVRLIKASGSSDVTVKGSYTVRGKVYLEASGASSITAATESGLVVVDASGASEVEVHGRTGRMEVEASGSSSIRADQLSSHDAEVHVSGASDVTLYVSGTLNAKASGAASVKYSGNPARVGRTVSGAASIEAVD